MTGLKSRETGVWTGLRSFRANPDKWSTILSPQQVYKDLGN